MKTTVISYSFTGNNENLANSIAAELNANQIKLTEVKRRTMCTIVLDMLFNREPKLNPVSENTENDFVLFIGPVWMGLAASPFRIFFRQYKDKFKRYAYASISGGALGPNPKLAGDLAKRSGKVPSAVIDLHIADLLPSDPGPTMKTTSSYRLNEMDIKNLTTTIVKSVKETMAKN